MSDALFRKMRHRHIKRRELTLASLVYTPCSVRVQLGSVYDDGVVGEEKKKNQTSQFLRRLLKINSRTLHAHASVAS